MSDRWEIGGDPAFRPSRRRIEEWKSLMEAARLRLSDTERDAGHTVDWEFVARFCGLDVDDFHSQPDGENAYTDLDVDAITEAAQRRFFSFGGEIGPEAVLTIDCQKCGRHIDELILQIDYEFGLDKSRLIPVPRVTSGTGTDLTQRTITYACRSGRRRCRRTGIQVSRRRAFETLDRLAKNAKAEGRILGDTAIATITA